MNLVDSFREELQVLGVEGAKVVVAVSGGPDSVALLRLFHEVAPERNLTLVVAHFHHGLRGADADADEQFVRALARELGLLYRVGRSPGTPSSRTETVEERARRERYAFLAAVAREEDAPFVATGHTADDQAETVLHRVIRGTGLAGLVGIPVRRPLGDGIEIVRPLLRMSRAELRRWLEERGYRYREDPTNEDPRFTRNRLRHEILPLLAQINPRVGEALCRLSSLAAEVLAIVDPLVAELESRCVLTDSEDRVILSVPALERAPGLLVREVFRRIWARHGWPEQHMSFEHWHQLAGLVHGGEGAWDLPGGIRARRLRGTVVLEKLPSQQAAESLR